MSKRVEISEIKEDATGRWHEILSNIAPELNDALKRCPKHGPCPVNGGKDGFRMFKDSRESGGGVSNSAGSFSNGFNLLMWVLDEDFVEVLNRVKDYLYGGDINYQRVIVAHKAPINESPSVDYEKRKRLLNEIWRESFSLDSPESSIARDYLSGRGINLRDVHANYFRHVRFNRQLSYWHDSKLLGKFPCIISLVSNAGGKPVSIHRIYLNENGGKLKVKADGVELPSKKLSSSVIPDSIGGGAARIGHSSHEIHVAEGLETAMAVSSSIKKPVWFSISATMLSKLRPPADVKTVHVWADKDKSFAGLISAFQFEKRMEDNGVDVKIYLPESFIPADAKSVDWNDVLVEDGKDEIVQAMSAPISFDDEVRLLQSAIKKDNLEIFSKDGFIRWSSKDVELFAALVQGF